jgi:hypothetical protein
MIQESLPWNLTHNRYAILGVPRSGTQLTESFVNYSLSKKFDHVVSLQEIFTAQASFFNTLTLRDGKLYFEEASKISRGMWQRELNSLNMQRLDLIAKAGQEQAMTCVAFLDDRISSIGFKQGLQYLIDLGFHFIYVNRSFEHKLISYMFAKKSFIFHREKNTMTLHIDTEELKSLIIARYLLEEQNKRVMDQLISYETVKYDSLTSMAEHLPASEKELAFGIFKEKQLSLDPYEQIVNADEVKEVFATFYPKLINLTDELF